MQKQSLHREPPRNTNYKITSKKSNELPKIYTKKV